VSYIGEYMKKIDKTIYKIIGKTIFKYKMIEPDDRILVAVSGGKDSITMLYDLAERQRSFPIKFGIEAIHIQTDFCTCCDKNELAKKIEALGVKYHVVDVAIVKRVKPGRTMNCYWCSMQRRMELLEFARNNGFNKIALGHHLDDIIETLLMNMCYKGQMSAMLPVLQYDKYPIKIIRPLAEVREDLIVKFVEEKSIKGLPCNCPYNSNSKRKEIKKSLECFVKGNDAIKYNIYNSIHNVNMKYML
jgi:tRNA 2-thiocytidine biosynthesis protein TtcA